MRRSGPPQRKQGLRRGRGFAASKQQREKVRDHGSVCAVCSAEDYEAPVDPAHVIPRSMGGCDHPACIVPLCRRCHRHYDTGILDLLPVLERSWKAELAHAVEHVGLVCALERITNTRWSEAA